MTDNPAAAENLAENPFVTCDRAVPVPMRDGVTLYADVYRPRQPDRLLPILLMRLPYGREIASTVVYAHPSWYATQGFIVVIQEVRGCGQSEGKFYPMQPQEMEDGADTLAWCLQLPGSNGKIGTYGFSYQGITQFQALAAGGERLGLTAIAPAMAAIEFYRGWCYWGGALALDLALPWGVQLAQDQAQFQGLEPDATELAQGRSQIVDWLNFTPLDRLELLRDRPVGEFYFDWVQETSADSDYYRRLNPQTYLERTHSQTRCTVPGLHIAGWADTYLTGSLHAYEWMVQHSDAPQWLIVGPWQHIPWSQRVGELDFGSDASPAIDRLQVRWFKHWLDVDADGKPLETELEAEPCVQLFEMGSNHWRMGDRWPPISQALPLWLGGNGLANGPDSGGTLTWEPPKDSEFPFDTYVYDPRIATPTTPYGPYKRNAIQHRPDVLVYTSAPLPANLTIAGVPVFHLFASTTAADTDWVVTLNRVDRSGAAMLMSAGVLRGRFRQSLRAPKPIAPDGIETYRIPLRATCWHITAGDCLQVAIASAAYPWIDRNPNTGGWPAAARWSEFQTATQTVFHTSAWPSHLELPQVEALQSF